VAGKGDSTPGSQKRGRSELLVSGNSFVTLSCLLPRPCEMSALPRTRTWRLVYSTAQTGRARSTEMIILFFLGKILAVVISSHLSSRSHDRCSQCRPIFLFLLANIIMIASHLSSRRHDCRSQCLPIFLFLLANIIMIASRMSSRRHDRCSQCRPIFLFLLANIIIIASRMSSRRHDRRSQCLPIFLFLSPSQHSPPGSPMQYCNVESTGNPPLRVLIVDVD